MPGSRSYFVYILASGHHGTLYIGVTNNIWRRMAQHRAGKGSKSPRNTALPGWLTSKNMTQSHKQ
jgi:predicted GIY-YIG superfamily endonuclease